jgi:hypothetical protein
MDAHWYDGRVATRQQASLAAEDGVLLIRTAGGEVERWPFASVREVAREGSRLRLAGPAGGDGRLVVEAADWAALLGDRAASLRGAARRKELKLVGGLAAAGLTFAAAVWFGIPAAAGPLARATPASFEEGIGENFDKQMRPLFPRCRSAGGRGQEHLQTLAVRLAEQTDMPFHVSVQTVDVPIVNAFALPGGKVLITDSLIELAETPEELAGVLAHEIAHVEQRHVMEAVWRAFGAGILLDLVVGGGTGAGQQAVLLGGSFTDLRYSREAEVEADARGAALLQAAGYSSRGLAQFFAKLENESSGEEARVLAEFLSTHPDTRRRVERARRLERDGRPPLTAKQWAEVKAPCIPVEKSITERLRIRR